MRYRDELISSDYNRRYAKNAGNRAEMIFSGPKTLEKSRFLAGKSMACGVPKPGQVFEPGQHCEKFDRRRAPGMGTL
jgi:hypothetical protein